MLSFIVVASHSLKDIYLTVYLSRLDIVALHFLIAMWVLSVMCINVLYTRIYTVIVSFISFDTCS